MVHMETQTNPNPPACRICDRPLTHNEFDAEPGAEPGYFSAHHACTVPVPAGRYVVVTFREGGQARSVATKPGYEHLRAAQDEAQYLADANYDWLTFCVWDRTDRRYVHNVTGALGPRPEPAPVATEFPPHPGDAGGFWREGATYTHRRTGTKHTITRLFDCRGELVAEYMSDHGPGQSVCSNAGEYVRHG